MRVQTTNDNKAAKYPMSKIEDVINFFRIESISSLTI